MNLLNPIKNKSPLIKQIKILQTLDISFHFVHLNSKLPIKLFKIISALNLKSSSNKVDSFRKTVQQKQKPMKQSFIDQSGEERSLKIPSKGLNTTVKNSIIFQKSIKQTDPFPNLKQKKEKLLREFDSRSQNFLENPTTYDNSLAKPNKVTKSMIKINLLNSSETKQSHSHSESKRKKFISITQREKEPKVCNSQKKTYFQTGKPATHDISNHQKNNTNAFSTFRQLITPANTLKDYWSTMIQTLSGEESKVEEREERGGFEENIMSQEVLLDHRNFSLAQRARIQRKIMMNSLIIAQTHRKNHARAHTEVQRNSQIKNDYILITEPQCPVDSRNFMVFEEKIGENTLTRKDSLIFALMDHFDQQDEIQQSNKKIQVMNGEIANKELIPSVHISELQLPTLTNRFTQLLVPQNFSHSQIRLQTQKKKPASIKTNRIKCVSLIDKQQSYKYRNSKNQPELEGQFIELKKKINKK